MDRIDPLRLGLTLGLGFGASHLAWALLVALGGAGWAMDVVFRLHFIRPPFDVDGFDPVVAAYLVGLTTLGGFLAGWGLGVVWNLLARPNRHTAPFR
jgi:hypothetical protein